MVPPFLALIKNNDEQPSRAFVHRAPGLWAILALIVLLVPSLSRATLVIPVAEDALVRQASAIVVGKVTAIESYWSPAEEQISTHVTISLQEVLKGILPVAEIILKQAGGTVGTLHSWIDGSPEFYTGERVLLFLSTNADGSARVLQLYQGKFSLFTDQDTGKDFAYRETQPHGVHVLHHPSRGASPLASEALQEESATLTENGFYDFQALKGRITAYMAQEQRQRSFPEQLKEQLLLLKQGSTRSFAAPSLRDAPALPIASEVQANANFTLLSTTPFRWFEPDSSAPVTIKINSTGESLATTKGFDQVRAALKAWSAVTTSSFRYQDGGFTTASGFRADGVNTVSFRDPLGQIDPPSGCSGVLAIGGASSATSEKRTIGSKVYSRIIEGDVVFADGWQGCDYYEDFANLAEVATHELGHVLGLGHSTDSTATMAAIAHFDRRGASLKTDDKSGLSSIYPLPCSVTLSSTSRSHAGGSGTGSVSVTASSSCSWTVSSSANWLTVNQNASGTGSKTVSYAVTVNNTTDARTATLKINDKTFTVTQAPGCSASISPTSRIHTASSATSSVSVSAGSICGWTAKNDVSWMSITTNASSAGSRTVSYLIGTNNTTDTRVGTLTIAGKTFTVTQSPGCIASISPGSRSHTASASMGNGIAVSASSICGWSAKSNASWLAITANASSYGSKTVSYSVAANTTTNVRVGTLTIAGKTFTVTQALGCTASISPSSRSHTAGANTGSVSVSASTTCGWTAVSNVSWLSIAANMSAAGSKTVSYAITANNTTDARTGILTIAGKTFTVTQASGCSASISPLLRNHTKSGGSGNILVYTSSSCGWTAKSNVSWITVTVNATGVGSKTASYSVAANTTGSSRAGTLLIAGKTFTVAQQ
jgi:hypothetical protein